MPPWPQPCAIIAAWLKVTSRESCKTISEHLQAQVSAQVTLVQNGEAVARQTPRQLRTGRPHSKPPGDFAKRLYLDSSIITQPVFEQAHNHTYTQDWPMHHALADARALMAGYRAWHQFME